MAAHFGSSMARRHWPDLSAASNSADRSLGVQSDTFECVVTNEKRERINNLRRRTLGARPD